MRSGARQVKLFRNGRNQALRIPRELELEGNRALVHREGDRLIVQPLRKGRLLAVLASLDPLDEPFPDLDEGRVRARAGTRRGELAGLILVLA